MKGKKKLSALVSVVLVLSLLFGEISFTKKSVQADDTGNIITEDYLVQKLQDGEWVTLDESSKIKNNDQIKITFNWNLSNDDTTSQNFSMDMKEVSNLSVSDVGETPLISTSGKQIGTYEIKSDVMLFHLFDEYVGNVSERKGGATINGVVNVNDDGEKADKQIPIGIKQHTINVIFAQTPSSLNVWKFCDGSAKLVDGIYKQGYKVSFEAVNGTVTDLAFQDGIKSNSGLSNMSGLKVTVSDGVSGIKNEYADAAALNEDLAKLSLKKGQSVVVAYTMDVDKDALKENPEKNYDNTATVTGMDNEETPQPISKYVEQYGVSIDKPSISKSGVEDRAHNQINWTITVNLRDYYKAGMSEAELKALVTSIVDTPGAYLKDKNSFNLDITQFTDNHDGTYTYTYSSKLEDGVYDLTIPIRAVNNVSAEIGGNTYHGGCEVGVGTGRDWLKKEFDSYDAENGNITWKVTLSNVPANISNVALKEQTGNLQTTGNHLIKDVYLETSGGSKELIRDHIVMDHAIVDSFVEVNPWWQEGRQYTINFVDSFIQENVGKDIVLYCVTHIDDGEDSAGKLYKNKVELSYKENNVDKSKDFTAEWKNEVVLTKSAQSIENKNGLSFSIMANLHNIENLQAGKSIILRDTLPQELILDEDSVSAGIYTEYTWGSQGVEEPLSGVQAAVSDGVVTYTIPITQDILNKIAQEHNGDVIVKVSYDTYVKDQGEFTIANQEMEYTNRVHGEYEGVDLGEASATGKIKPADVVIKNAVYTKATAPNIEYEVDVNPNAVKLSETGFIQAKDVIGRALVYDFSTLKIEKIDAQNQKVTLEKGKDYSYSYNADENSVTFTKLPDETYLKIYYKARVVLPTYKDSALNGKLTPENSTNTFSLYGYNFDGSEDSKSWSQLAITPDVWAESDTGILNVHKYWNNDGTMESLDGCAFEIYEYDFATNQNKAQFVMEEEKNGTIESTSTFYVDENGDLKVEKLKYDTYYALYEVKAKEGFVRNTEPKFFVLTGKDHKTLPEGVKGYNLASGLVLEYENEKETVTPVSVQFKGSKTVEGKTDSTQEFSFVLRETTQGMAYTDTVSVAGEGDFAFDVIKYTKAGTHTYTIRELRQTVAGYTYDTRTYNIKVVVTEKDGKLSAAVTGDLTADDSIADVAVYSGADFTNVYKATPVSVTLGAHKTLVNEKGVAPQESYTFVLTETTEGASYTDTREVNANANAAFKAIQYTEEGTYTYTITEKKGKTKFLTYDINVYKVTVDVKDVNGRLTATVKDQAGRVVDANAAGICVAAELTNIYNEPDVTATSVTFGGHKTLTGIAESAEKFEMVLTERTADGAVKVDTAETVGNSDYVFQPIVYNKAGTYYYIITETVPENLPLGYTYNSANAEYSVTVEVSMDENKKLSANVIGLVLDHADNIYKGADFTNTYKEPEYDIQVRKVIAGTMQSLGGAMVALYKDGVQVGGTVALPPKGYTFTGLTAGNYTIKEIKAPMGFLLAKGETSFTLAKDGTITVTSGRISDGVLLVEDDLTEVTVSKVDIANDEELPGARLQILDGKRAVKLVETSEAGKTVLEVDVKNNQDAKDYWISTTAPVTIKGLAAGIVYTLHEETAPAGYKLALDTTFTISEDGEIKQGGTVAADGRLVIRDALIDPQKVTFGGRKTLEGISHSEEEFEFVLKEKDGTILDTTTVIGSGEYRFEELSYDAPGTYEYTIEETNKGTEGYEFDARVYHVKVIVTDNGAGKFDIAVDTLTKNDNGDYIGADFVNKYIGIDGSVVICKKDAASKEEIAGAAIQILEKDANGEYTKVAEIIDENGDKEKCEWISDGTPKVIVGLDRDKSYVLHEETAPDGYMLAMDMEFHIDNDGKVIQAGEVRENGLLDINDSFTSVSISKVDIADGQELEGAVIQILEKDANGEYTRVADAKDKNGNNFRCSWVSTKDPVEIRGLKTGVVYSLHEEAAPDGYTVASDTRFMIDENGKVYVVSDDGSDTKVEDIDKKLVVEDSITSILVSKKAAAGEDEIPGAKLQILNHDGTTMMEWTSGATARTITGLKTEETYTLREKIAPAGYTVVSDITFRLDKDGKITNIQGSATGAGTNQLVVRDDFTSVTISKRAVTGDEELPGAKLQILDEQGNIVELETADGSSKEKLEWISGNTPKVIKGLKAVDEEGNSIRYVLHEETAPDGYTIAADTEFTITADGIVTSAIKDEATGALILRDSLTSVKVNKVDIVSGEELSGAVLRIMTEGADGKCQTVKAYDETGAIVDCKWTAAGKAKEFRGLKTETEYILHEETAPDGYLLASDTTFTISKDGQITGTTTVKDNVMLVQDSAISIKVSKIDATNQNELAGARIKITDTRGNLVDEWVSETQPRVVTNIVAGEIYTIEETVAPEGYVVAAKTTFCVDQEGKVAGEVQVDEGTGVILIEDNMTSVSISKREVNGKEELAGAELEILDNSGEVVQVKDENGIVETLSWTSGTAAKNIKGLAAGKEYILRETVAPAGYEVAEDTRFTLSVDGKVTIISGDGKKVSDDLILLENKLMPIEVKITKTDITGQEELAGALIQIKDETGAVVREWTSAAEPEIITGLREGVVYTLHEETAPNGYVVADDTTFSINEQGEVLHESSIAQNNEIIIKDSLTSISISKIDATNQKELAGATIQIKDNLGNVVEQWVSADKAHIVTGLTAGVTYILHEEAAPDGYKLAADTKFSIDKYGRVTAETTTSADGTLIIEDNLTHISFSKVGLYNESCSPQANAVKKLAGAEFTAYAVDDPDVAVARAVSDENGLVVFEKLPLGNYYIRETKSVEGYKLNNATYFARVESVDFEGLCDEDGRLLEENQVVNDVYRTDISLTKVNEQQPDQVLPNSTYGLFKEKPGSASGELVKVSEAVTDKDGVIIFDGVLMDTEYIVQELKAPDGSYVSKYPVKIGFIVNEDNEIVVENFDSGNGTGYLDEETGKIIWFEPSVEYSFVKVDENGKMLAGAKLQVQDESGSIVAEWTSKAEPYMLNNVLVTGRSYKLVETEAPKGYKLAPPAAFTVNDETMAPGENKVVTVTMTDEKESTTVDDTITVKDNQNTIKKAGQISDQNKTGDNSPIIPFSIACVISAIVLMGLTIGERSCSRRK